MQKRTFLLILSLLFSVPGQEVSAAPRAIRSGVTVTVTQVENLGTRCFDQEGSVCGAPDYFAVVRLTNSAGERAACSSIDQAAADMDQAVPGWTCSGDLDLDGLTLHLQIWDQDGEDTAEQADILMGDGLELVLPITENTSGSSEGEDTKVSYNVTLDRQAVQLSAITLDRAAVDPSMGETVAITGTVQSPKAGVGMTGEEDVNLNLAIYNPAAQLVKVIDDPVSYDPASGEFRFVWDGKLGNENAAVALYTFEVSAYVGTSAQATSPVSSVNAVQVTRRRATEMGVFALDPTGSWYPGSETLRFNFWQGGSGSAGMNIYAGASCGVGDPVRKIAVQPVKRGLLYLEWDGKDDNGEAVDTGLYSLELYGLDPDGNPTLPSTFCRSITLTSAPELHLSVNQTPILALTGGQITITAAARDEVGNSRPTGTIEVWTASPAEVDAGQVPALPSQVCQRASVCSYTLDAGKAEGRLAFRATAYDDQGERIETPWRLVDVVDLSNGAPAHTVMAGVITQSPWEPLSGQGFDWMFIPSQDFNLDNLAGRMSFLNIAEESAVGMEKDAAGTSIWIDFTPVQVTGSDPFDPDAQTNLCQITFPTNMTGEPGLPTFVTIGGVIHDQVCRDTASGRMYTAGSPAVSQAVLERFMSVSTCQSGGCE